MNCCCSMAAAPFLCFWKNEAHVHTDKCSCCRSEASKFMDSKMRPLWCVWQNMDATGPDVYMMYKNGDGEQRVRRAARWDTERIMR